MAAATNASIADFASQHIAPPQAMRQAHQVISPNGNREDEYFWLRDDTRMAPAVLQYLAQENAYTDAVLEPLADLEGALLEELTARLAPEDESVPEFDRGYWYYRRYRRGEEYPVYVRHEGSLEAPEEIILDVNALAAGHEYFAIGAMAVSPDNQLLAYTEDRVGRRQYTLRIRELAGGRTMADQFPNIEPDVVWAMDSRTVLIVEKDPDTLLSVRVRAHTLGADAAQARLVYEEPDDSYFLGLGKSRSEQFVFIICESTQQSEWLAIEAADPLLRVRSVVPREAGHEYEVEHLEGDFILRTNWQAPNFRIVRTPIGASADKCTWADVIAHRAQTLIEGFLVFRGHIAVNERRGAMLGIRVRPWSARTGSEQDIVLDSPEPAYAMQLVHTPDITSGQLRYRYSSLTTPATTYDYDLARNCRAWRKTEPVLGGFVSANYATELCWAPADDGARIPVSLAYRIGTPLDGTAPIYQHGYGAYGYSLDPGFRSQWISLMDRGFVVAIAHVRGGQELGRAWYDAGRLRYKRNSFTDFIAVTEFLVAAGYGAPDKVCAQGGSAGGLLMGAVANLAPQRYRAIVAHVPFVDIVTTMLDESIPLTTNEFDQWGDPRDLASYEYMLSYSPYDNVRNQAYPAMMIFTGLWDSQVQYFEPAKWVARLRARKTDQRPLLFSIDMGAGHGGKSGRFARFRETAREYAFLLWQLGNCTLAQEAT